jgi:serine/threonine protein kinase
LIYNPKYDKIGSGGYGEVFRSKWLGLDVAVKKFGKKYVNKKAL